MGKRRSIVSAFISIVLTALMWEFGDALPRMTFAGKIVLCGFVFVISYILGRILSGG